MGTQRLFGVFLLVLVLAAVTQHSHAAQKQCSSGCRGGANSVFQYSQGHTYVYNVEGSTLTNLPGTQGDGVKLQLKATAELSILSECNQLLRLKNVQVIGSDSKKYDRLSELETHPVRFNFQDGKIDKELCAEEGDDPVALNIKRAIISLLQVSSTRGSTMTQEWDVFGSCPTYIDTSKSGDTITVTKTRNLNKCYHREGLNQEILSSVYNIKSETQSSPLLDSSLKVEQRIKKGIINSALSQETYLFRPFANRNAGARTTVETKLTLVSHQRQAAPSANVNHPRTIVFEGPHGTGTASSSEEAITAALKRAGDTMKTTVGETSAHEFAALVHVLRHSNKENIVQVYGRVRAGAGFPDKRSSKKLFLDALLKAGTGDSVEVAVELLKNNQITGDYAKLWYLSFGFARHATLGSLSAVSTLLDEPNLPSAAFLGIGSLAGRYCAEHNCDNVAQFDELLQKLASHLGDGCKVSSRDQENTIIAVLKALHNVHHLNGRVSDTLAKCAADTALPARIRVAALETFQSDASQPKLKKAALDILKNKQEDSEIRIKAYLTVVECACGKVANALKELLETETVNQVGSFIVSHLRNLRASTNPEKQAAKEQLGLVKTTRRFPEDFRKFSHNYELSYILDAANIGNSLESNVIFSQKSYIPRSVSLNLTTEIFGHSFNLLEFGARAENLERVMESYLSPKGYFETHDIDEVIDAGEEAFSKLTNKIKERFQHTMRSRRSVSQQDLEQIRQKAVQSLGPDYEDKDVDIDLSLKMFGSEISWLNYHGNTEEFTPGRIIDQIFDSVDGAFNKAKNIDIDMKNHFTFLETEISYPTGLGFPLKLVAAGSTALHLKLKGNVDIPAIARDPKNSNFRLEVVPSAVVEINGQLVVDAYAVESGLKLAATLHTATGADVHLKNTEGVGFDITFGLPVKNQDIISIKSEVLSTVQERGHPEVDTPVQFNTQRKDYHGCFDQVSPLIGLTFCGEVGFPWDPVNQNIALYPLNGNTKLALRVDSDDVSSYHLRFALNNKDPKRGSLEILFETPGSKTDRKLGLEVEVLTEPTKQIKAILTSPWKQLLAEANVVDTASEHTINAKLRLDNSEYLCRGGVEISGSGNRQTYTPVWEYSYPGQPEKQTKSRKSGKSGHAYNVGGSITVDKLSPSSRKYTYNKVFVNTPQGKYEVDGTISHDNIGFESDLKLSHGQDNVILRSKVQKPGPHKYILAADVLSSQYPDLGLSLKYDVEVEKGYMDEHLVLIHGNDLKSETARVTINRMIKYRFESIRNFEYETKNSATYPLMGVELKLDAKATPKTISYDLEGSYETYKFESELDAKTGVNKPGDYEIEFQVKALKNSLEFESKREVISSDKSKFTNKLSVHPGGKYELVADVTHVYEINNINQQLKAVLKVHGEPQPYKLDTGLIVNPQLVDSHFKVNAGNVDYIDISGKYNKGGNPSGNIKVVLKDYVDGLAQFKYNNGKGSATLNIDIPKIHRKIKGTGDLTISGSSHVASVDLYWNADKDPSQHLQLQTNTDLKKNAIDSKNTITILDYKTVANVKGSLTGKMTDGQIVGDAELILPCGMHLTAKVDRTVHIRSTNSDVNVKLELTAQPEGSQPNKLTLDVEAKNIDRNQMSIDGHGKAALYLSNGKDATLNVILKNIPQREQRVFEFENKLDGSLMGGKPVHLKAKSEISQTQVTYEGQGTYGTDTSVDISGKINKGLDGKVIIQHDDDTVSINLDLDNTIEVVLPTEHINKIKLVSRVNIDIKEDAGKATTDNTLMINGDKTYKLGGEVTGTETQGSGKVELTLPGEQPRSLAGTWHSESDNKIIKDGGSIAFGWAGNKELKLTADLVAPHDMSTIDLHITAETPVEKYRNIDFVLKNKVIGVNNEVDSTMSLTVDSKKLEVTTKVTEGICEMLPNIDFRAVDPQGTTRLLINLQKKDEHQLSGDIEAEWHILNKGQIAINIDSKIESVDSFNIKLNVDSDALKLNKWNIVLANKPTKGGKHVVVSATSAGQNVLSGRLEYKTEERPNYYKYSVRGNLRHRDESLPVSVEAEMITLTLTENNEAGVEVNLKGNVGERSLNSVHKFTNREVHLGGTACLKKDQCIQTELLSKVTNKGLTEYNHDLTLVIDLTGIGMAEKLDVKANTVYKTLFFDSNVEVKLKNKHDTTYKSHIYLNDKNAGVVLTLPKRVIAAEANAVYSVDKERKNGEYTLEANLWLDKTNQPNLKSGLYITYKVNTGKDGIIVTGETKVTHPSLGNRDLVVKGRALLGTGGTVLDSTVDIDIFSRRNQKIVVETKLTYARVSNRLNMTSNVNIQSKGQNIDVQLLGSAEASTESLGVVYLINYKDKDQAPKDAGLIIDISPKNLLISVKSPTSQVVLIEGKLKVTDSTLKSESKVEITGLEPYILKVDMSLPPKIHAIAYKSNQPNKKIEFTGTFDLMKAIGVRADLIQNSEKKELYKVHVSLSDDHFLETDIDWSIDNIKGLLEWYHKEVITFLKRVKVVIADLGKELTTELTDLVSGLRKAQPNLKAVIASYKQQLNVLKTEIANDPSVKELSSVINKALSGVLQGVAESLENLTEALHKLLEELDELENKLKEAFNKLIPAVTESYSKVVAEVTEVLQKATDVALTQAARIVDIIKRHENDIKEFTKLLAEFMKDMGKIMGKSIIQIRKELKEFVTVLVDQVKEVPLYSIAKEKYEEALKEISELVLPEQTLAVLQELISGVKDSMPTAELKQLVADIETYLDKKLKKQAVNDLAELQAILNQAITAVQSLIGLLQTEEIGSAEPTGLLAAWKLPVSITTILQIPQLLAAKFSPLALLTSGELPTIEELIYTYRPTLNPLDWIPPYRSYGMIIDAHHFITFDNRHYTFKGTCSYILTQDIIDGNFTVVLNLEGGKLKSIQLSDAKDTLELFADNSIKLNGAPTEYPAHSGDLSAWRRYHSANLKSKAGVHIIADIGTNVYTIRVSGFYHGRTRGLLGTLNNEAGDEFTMPNGQITTNVNDFGNSWKVNSGCGDVTGPSHHDHEMPHVPECTDIFTGSSSLKLCFPFLHPDTFREACDHIVADASNQADKKTDACSVAAAYTLACSDQGINVDIPSSCAQCSVGGGSTIDVGETASIKVPQGAADIVVLVEQVSANADIFKELVIPLITTLTTQLKSKGIPDVHFTLVGFGGKGNKWPMHYTSGGKLVFDGKTKNIRFVEPEESIPFDTPEHKFEWVLHQLEVELGVHKFGEAVTEVLNYPYRPGASRAYIGVFGQPCESSLLPLFIQQLRIQLAQKFVRDAGYSTFAITPVEDIHIPGKDAKQIKQIVGFDADHVYSLSDLKKKNLEGSTTLRKSIEYKPNICIDIPQATHGATFVSQNFLELKGSPRKQFVQVIAHRISESLEAELFEDCTCALYNGHHAESHCRVTGRKERERLVARKTKT